MEMPADDRAILAHRKFPSPHSRLFKSAVNPCAHPASERPVLRV
jgi:hypothetical protein